LKKKKREKGKREKEERDGRRERIKGCDIPGVSFCNFT
jgi:hypothetical protein